MEDGGGKQYEFKGYRFRKDGGVEFFIDLGDGTGGVIGLPLDETYVLAIAAIIAYAEADPETAPPVTPAPFAGVRFGFFDQLRVMRISREDGAFLDIAITESQQRLLAPVFDRVAKRQARRLQ